MIRIITIAAIALSITACTSTRNCVTAVSLDSKGELSYERICPRLGPPTMSNGSIAGPHMAAPAPGDEWWNIGR